MSHFDNITLAPPDAVFGLNTKYKADTSARKLNLGVGAYRDGNGQPYVLEAVREAERQMLAEGLNKEYQPIDGHVELRAGAAALMFGADHAAIKENRIASAQAIGGTGCLRLAASFIAMFFNDRKVYITNPTWGNHKTIFQHAGLQTESYAYFLPATCMLDLPGLLRDLNAAPDGSVVVLHACAHNPTGVDPTIEEWGKIADVITAKKLLPLFDCAYQGFAKSLDDDAAAPRLFASRGIEFFLAQSFSKNLGLYAERVGVLSLVCNTTDTRDRVQSQLKVLCRALWSNPPVHGARIAAKILNDDKLGKLWREELTTMCGRLQAMRNKLHDELVACGAPGDWSHVKKQIGMFSFTGLKPEHVQALQEKHHVYMLGNGRISVAGLREQDCAWLANAIKDVLT